MTVRIRKAGQVTDCLWYLGREEAGIYLLEGRDRSMIISGGMCYIIHDVLDQLQHFGIDMDRIETMLILHAHFDHLGIIPYFKRTWPRMEVLASARAWEIVKMPKAVDTINAFGRMVTEKMGFSEIVSPYDVYWRNDVSGMTVHEGDHIDLGGLNVEIIETPGHSSCSISAYVPEIKALFASDGGGIPYKEMIIPLGNSNFTQFQSSLEKLKPLEVDYLCADHYGYVTGDESRSFIGKAVEEAARLRAMMEETYGKSGNVDSAASELVGRIYAENPDYFMSQEITEGIFRQMLKHIAGVKQLIPGK
jgi:2-aminobenzoylacetyl-CoA thioesterase